jgi:hypothetical protein
MGGLGAFGDVLGKGLGMAGGGNGQHKETVLHDGEGPIWKVEWNPEGLIAWANDLVRPLFAYLRVGRKLTHALLPLVTGRQALRHYLSTSHQLY